MHADRLYIGMDLGGTTFKALAVTPEGDILKRVQDATHAWQGPTTVMRRMCDAIHQLRDDLASPARRLAAVGFGIPGIIELPAGIVRRSPNLPGWEGFDVRAALSQQLDVSYSIENDANAAVHGEAWLGAGRDYQHVLMLTLGTGVGGGVILGGRLLHGANGYAGEVGHTMVAPNGPRCGCGSDGCLEQFVSGAAIARMAAPYYGTVTAKDVSLAAQRGEAEALAVYRQVGHYLGIACASFANLFNPQCIVLGGAAAQAFDFFIESMRTTMRQRTFVEVYEALHIVPAQCGPDAGGLGAAYQAMQDATGA